MTVTTLVVRFVLGRYHATPWGRHVNEGQVELPPAPWRLLRALYAVWKARVPDLDVATAHELLARLAEPPEYYVPPHALAHTRHYYPDSKSRTGTPSVDRTLDAFAALDRDATLAVRWRGVELSGEQEKALSRLAEAMPYLGRADSLCEAGLDPSWQPDDSHQIWSPLDVSESIPAAAQTVTLLAPTLPLDVDALTARPVDVRANRLLFPPSTRFVGYFAAQPAVPPRRTSSASRRKPVEAVRFSITSRVRPPYLQAVAYADLLRRASLARLGRIRPTADVSLLAGRAVDETKLTDHQHSHFLALPYAQRRIRDLIVWTPGGLAGEELEAVAGIRRLVPPDWMSRFRPIDVRVSGYGDADDVLADIRGPKTRWRSLAPYVPARHPKRDWAAFLEADVRRELSYRNMPAPTRVELLEETGEDWRSFLRYRPTKRLASATPSGRGSVPGQFLALTFPEPVSGPLALGYLSHFGLGLFGPVPES